MRRTASEVLRDLDNRIARLENRSASTDHPTIAKLKNAVKGGALLEPQEIFQAVEALNATQTSKGRALYALYSIVIGATYGKGMADGGVQLYTPKEKPKKASDNLKKHWDISSLMTTKSSDTHLKFLESVQSHINVINSEIAKIKNSL